MGRDYNAMPGIVKRQPGRFPAGFVIGRSEASFEMAFGLLRMRPHAKEGVLRYLPHAEELALASVSKHEEGTQDESRLEGCFACGSHDRKYCFHFRGAGRGIKLQLSAHNP